MWNKMEQQRLSFLLERDGLKLTYEFARQTMRLYSTCVLRSRKRGFNTMENNPHHASLPKYHASFIQSYCDFKIFLKNNRSTYENIIRNKNYCS